MQIVIDISKDRYDEIMSMDWKNCRLIFDEELRAIHDGKALEQEPCGDAVSRQAVLDINERYHGQMPNHVNHEIWKEIKALPPATPTPKMGRWIKQTLSVKPFGEDTVLCDQCAFMTDKDSQYNYCPNCGTRMMQEVRDADID